MSNEKKITDEELKHQIEQGKTFKQIAYDFGYGYPTQTLSERARELGYRSNSRFTLQSWGGATISLDSGTLERAMQLSGVESFTEDGKRKMFKHNQVVEDTDSFELQEGDIVLRLSENAWRREE